jgi:hypothetical protein
VLTRSSLAVTWPLACVSPVDCKWHLSMGDMQVQYNTHWVPLPELPQGSVVV